MGRLDVDDVLVVAAVLTYAVVATVGDVARTAARAARRRLRCDDGWAGDARGVRWCATRGKMRREVE